MYTSPSYSTADCSGVTAHYGASNSSYHCAEVTARNIGSSQESAKQKISRGEGTRTRLADDSDFDLTRGRGDDGGVAGIVDGQVRESQSAAAQVDLVQAVPEIGDDILKAGSGCPGGAENKQVFAGATEEQVVAGTANQFVRCRRQNPPCRRLPHRPAACRCRRPRRALNG
jgi:hypothetical protein